MAMTGTYVADVPLKGLAEKHYRRWRSQNNIVPDAIGHHIQGVTVHDGDWDSHGSIKSWNYTIDGKPEVIKEKREIDDEKMALTFRGLDGHVIEEYKVYDVILQFIPKSKEGCVCKVTLIWEKRKEDSPEPTKYMKFVQSLVADMDDHILKGQNKA
ncbi:PREDICTED: MLP-like protein 328 [Camelina sativa]|uniref:MLP-like protein 328 n=1 Tax=Camelina sativa TaxID=90675 RepID=A0ABM0VNX5_CAMSA|nr:PREDICTED: MLP-like protein 328 [Camelina sativa]